MASPSHRSLRAFKTGCADEYASTKTPCAISDLETQLRARLFNRTTRRIVLTGVGERYLRRCKQALAYVDEAQGRTRASRRKAQGLFDGQLGSTMLSKQSGGIRSGIPTFASKLPSRNGCLTCLRMATISRSSLHAKFPIPPLCHTVLEAHSTSSAAPPLPTSPIAAFLDPFLTSQTTIVCNWFLPSSQQTSGCLKDPTVRKPWTCLRVRSRPIRRS
jgi:hypothetical protein